MGLFGLIGLIVVILGLWQLFTGALLFGIILVIVGLVIASWGGSSYWRGRAGPPL